MSKTGVYIAKTKHIMLMCLVLFALSPCIIKEVLLDAVNVEYTSPLNKSKSTSGNSCLYSGIDNIQNSIVKQPTIVRRIKHLCLPEYRYATVGADKTNVKYSKNFSGNSPPKYILYKRLKLDMA